ncbi:MAG: alpha-galactosidase [Clostridia bacterium]|nr:alpha-galactosidase [Clostridia bacterium]NCC43419.1 alpha-galactosidase [Clostridia bacterium]
MSEMIKVDEQDLHVVFEVDDSKNLRLLHFGNSEFLDDIKEEDKHFFRPFELLLSGEQQCACHIGNYFESFVDGIYLYKEHKEYLNEKGRKLEFYLEGRGMAVSCHYQFMKGTSVVRSWLEVENLTEEVKTLEYLSSFAMTGLHRRGVLSFDEKCRVWYPHNAWSGEMRWRSYSLPELGMTKCGNMTFKRITCNTCGTWSSGEYLPMGYTENTETGEGIMWQIEHNGSWYWEISDYENFMYLNVCGPNDKESHWFKNLKKGERFVAVPVAVGAVCGGFEKACAEFTRYRRNIIRPHRDNADLPVIFNDWMNCLMGDQSKENLIPIIDAAAESGCEYFCLDAGWFVEPGEDFNVGMGNWVPSEARFKGGFLSILDYIRSKGMIPGMWLEIEVMACVSPVVKEVPSDWLFQRHGHPLVTGSRYQLDFRNPEVVAFADKVVDRMVKEYGLGYIKMDYNHNAGPGTELHSDSEGDGLLEHARAYIQWLGRVLDRHPGLIIENCGSGGMRIDYALLSKHSIQSVSDQGDYRKFAHIAAASPSAIIPEQSGIWSYPVRESDEEATIFNMVNAMLLRIHQSGRIDLIRDECVALVKEGISYYKSIRKDIPFGEPFWPIGFPMVEDGWMCLGLDCGSKIYLAVWRLANSIDHCSIPLDILAGKKASVTCAYPQAQSYPYSWNETNQQLSVRFDQIYSARLYEIQVSE